MDKCVARCAIIIPSHMAKRNINSILFTLASQKPTFPRWGDDSISRQNQAKHKHSGYACGRDAYAR